MSREFIDVPAYFYNGTYTAVVSVNTRVPELAQLAYSDDLVEKGPLPDVLGSGSPEVVVEEGKDQAVSDIPNVEKTLDDQLKAEIKNLIDQINNLESYVKDLKDKGAIVDGITRSETIFHNFRMLITDYFMTKIDDKENGGIMVPNDQFFVVNNTKYKLKSAKDITTREYEDFKYEFKLYYKTDRLISTLKLDQHRAFYKVILANIAIALTGIGAILLAAHAIHDRVKKGSETSVNSALFFGRTRREKMAAKVKPPFDKIESIMEKILPRGQGGKG